ncbi:DUF2165 domain-containing protein [Roseibium sp. RKSG952]|uniref:DUF2165 family protein n=1 Tax=Roseibium sp. RKSG952 TaxID=2529384 RepID=UPI001AD92910
MSGKIVCFQVSKVLLVGSAGLFALLTCLSNLQDPQANLPFVRHVLSMDTVFPNTPLFWRAITNPTLHYVAFAAIVVAEFLVAALCLFGAFKLARNIGKPEEAFENAKGLSAFGLTLGVLLWFTGFLTIGGEWFLMWQSSQWSGTEAAFLFSALLLLILIYLKQPET